MMYVCIQMHRKKTERINPKVRRQARGASDFFHQADKDSVGGQREKKNCDSFNTTLSALHTVNP